MYQIVYISTMAAGFGRDDLRAILAVSRCNNARDGLTGMLLFNGRRFLQALEGDEQAVGTAFDRIRVDHRHLAVVKLSGRHIAAREFGTWAMAAEDLGLSDDAVLEQVDRLTRHAGEATRAHFLSYAALKPV